LLPAEKNRELIVAFYRTLLRSFGPQHWWPARSALEVILGTFLVQNTAWINAERALQNLRTRGLIQVPGIRGLSLTELEDLIRPAGYFRQKARNLQNFIAFLDARYSGSLQKMFTQETAALRAELLARRGIGPETDDSILLYAGQRPVFVVDAYTRRIALRHGLFSENAAYHEVQQGFASALAEVAFDSPIRIPTTHLIPVHQPSRMSRASRSALSQTYNQMHGLMVATGKHFCHKTDPACAGCPLKGFLNPANTTYN